MLPENIRIAIVCDWLRDRGGAELVLEYIAEAFPTADIYTSVYAPERFPFLAGRQVFTSFIQYIPFFSTHPKVCPFLRPHAFESFDLSGYDLVISSSSAESKGIITRPDTLHVCYCHTPTRYYWSHYHEYRDMLEFGWLNPLARVVMPPMIHRLRMWDYLAAQRVDTFIANSHTTAGRIAKYYGRESTVVMPGIDTTRYGLAEGMRDGYYLAIGRTIPYKKFDLLVDTFNQNKKPLIIATSTENRLSETLRRRSNANIEWRFHVSEPEKIHLYQHARAYLMPQEEDFGITPLEAMACGTPVVAYRRGGARETVVEGETGVFFATQSVESLADAIDRCEIEDWSPVRIHEHAKKFDKQIFQENLYTTIEGLLKGERR